MYALQKFRSREEFQYIRNSKNYTLSKYLFPLFNKFYLFYILISQILVSSLAFSIFLSSIFLTSNLITKDWTNQARACAIFNQYNTGLKKSCMRESKTQKWMEFSSFLSVLFFQKYIPRAWFLHKMTKFLR